MKVLPVVLAGGSGSRLWPLSRKSRPKQFLPLVSGQSMLQETLSRLNGLAMLQPIVICNDEHRFMVAEQLREIDLQAHILLEPVGRNTAPAIALAALYATQSLKEPVTLLVLAADHAIQNVAAFQEAIMLAATEAEQQKLVTFGILPTYAATGYGYIKAESINSASAARAVEGFVEKPDLPTAQAFMQTGEYFWNSGMFAFQASVFLQELETYRPDIHQACVNAIATAGSDLDFIRIDAQAFSDCPSESIDYAVMEKTRHASMVPLDAGWSDVGNWAALRELKSKDAQGNDCHGDVWLQDCENNSVYANQRMVAAVGVKDLIIVETEDAILVADQAHCEAIKTLVNRLSDAGRSEANSHKEVFRPWGKYVSLGEGERFQVKRITVRPRGRLSLQKHYHRAEHWIVVSGTAQVVRGEETYMVTENESTYIPCGEVHRLDNPGCIDLELIEVQSGSYLGEDDIVRLEDVYGRSEKS
ncbi:mannose-1-phosphate guanylyltransferase/mannose-6-phosphate isomerase [Nitrincola iocasae]|uniref:mannose-1-phosphate guanylyltransferase n=1 Tax=Nitrincola iocasae TaxID=2614693 RepID=A0A5J6LDD3_9GAMM|nr:mannose-1-phosphate guanylyltransferase/mannose-6-phosphate isomerase [Nitrincola iocasae]QEW06252.1 mannose-1-phosphate guanylyltransferase/mannose-6-phosphate isomerase [Nitrincola iocasae]